ncbi:MAG: dihydropteroate synthase [Verrucomicrobia bacterium]|nr:dihydropteroate synthase [Verrucomicrobiota bacterium]MDI9379860.1 dihydropteroate synthase [Verrucomicrobiota bacterium]NMD21438.1 dihydropteroate synthase [Verrucomicrobiota bacterium]HNU98475.1 dihydropteroate synthase [Verrucomicrobiota bacterium]HOA61663.1 dihydropteroate synthase [Verrucomicrobiota bacterium]
MRWSCRRFEFVFPRPALVMGIVNVTPDSFSDGGRYFDPGAAIAHARELVAEGADFLDVGGESMRPNATPVSEAEELRRILPVIEELARQVTVPLSVDTRKSGVARAALAAGASLVNDVEARRSDDALWRVVADAQAGYVCMHMQGTPATMQQNPTYTDVVREVGEFFTDRLARLARCGVGPDQVALDVGIGFGKDLDHNLDLLAGLESYKGFHRPLLLGVSRKSFLGRLLGVDLDARLPAALACTAWAANAGVQVFRTHDVAATCQALRVIEALRARAATAACPGH